MQNTDRRVAVATKAVTDLGKAPSVHRMKSTLYKLVLDNRIIAEGSKGEMRKQLKCMPSAHAEKRAFIGQSPSMKIGDVWNSAFPSF
jgi:hypothetical protein